MGNTSEEFIPFKYTIRGSPVERTMFLKRHEGKDDVKPNNRTLYLVNIPQFVNEKGLKDLFGACGDIERMFIQSKPSSGLQTAPITKLFSQQKNDLGNKVGYIVFKNPESLKKALKPKGKHNISNRLSTEGGKKKWTQEYNYQFVDSMELYNEIKSFMSEFDRKGEEEKIKAKESEGVVDEEGWVTVTKFSKKPKIPRTDSASKKLMEKQNRVQAKQRLINFYKCQLRDAKMDQIAELRKKFENDKQRLALMKASRKFKPF